MTDLKIDMKAVDVGALSWPHKVEDCSQTPSSQEEKINWWQDDCISISLKRITQYAHDREYDCYDIYYIILPIKTVVYRHSIGMLL